MTTRSHPVRGRVVIGDGDRVPLGRSSICRPPVTLLHGHVLSPSSVSGYRTAVSRGRPKSTRPLPTTPSVSLRCTSLSRYGSRAEPRPPRSGWVRVVGCPLGLPWLIDSGCPAEGSRGFGSGTWKVREWSVACVVRGTRVTRGPASLVNTRFVVSSAVRTLVFPFFPGPLPRRGVWTRLSRSPPARSAELDRSRRQCEERAKVLRQGRLAAAVALRPQAP